MIIKKQDYVLDVDVQETANYYNNVTTPCECYDCRNYCLQAKNTFPSLTKFLAELGADISRPDELGAHNIDGEVCYQFVSYTIAGKILQRDKYEIDMTDGGMFLNIVIDDSYIPNKQRTERLFTVTVYGIQLPWKLEEPYPKEHLKISFINKAKRFLKSKKGIDNK